MAHNQHGFYLTDQEFIQKWKENPSPTLMAKATGLSVRAAQNRRRTIEIRHNVKLDTTADVKNEYNEKQKALAAERKKQRQEQVKSRIEQSPINVRRGMALEKGRVICFSDAHFWPNDTTTAFKALIKFIEHFKPQAIVCNGDAFDGSGGISRFPRIGWQKTPTVKEEIEACQFYLGEIEKVAKGAQLIWTMGNHDARLTNYIAANAPHLEGLPHTELKDFFPLWKPCWSFWVNDDTVIKHRLKGGRYAGYNNATATLGQNIITGHTHVLCASPLSAYGKTIWGVQTGTLAEPTSMQFADYTEDAPHDWRSGFVMLSWDRGRMLMPELIQVCGENEVEFRGEILSI